MQNYTKEYNDIRKKLNEKYIDSAIAKAKSRTGLQVYKCNFCNKPFSSYMTHKDKNIYCSAKCAFSIVEKDARNMRRY